MESLPVRISECLNALYQCRTSNSVSEDSVPYQAPLPEHFEIRTAAVSPATTISTISNMQRDPKQRFSGTSFSTWSSGFLFHGSQNVRRRSRQACSPRRSTGCWSMTDSTRPMWGWCHSWILGSSKRNSKSSPGERDQWEFCIWLWLALAHASFLSSQCSDIESTVESTPRSTLCRSFRYVTPAVHHYRVQLHPR